LSLLCLWIFVVFLCQVLAQEEEVEEEGSTDEGPLPSEPEELGEPALYSTYAIFPNHRTLKVPAGDIVDVVASFNNRLGKDEYSVVAIRGYLASPFDTSQIVYNLSTVFYNDTIDMGEEQAFWYRFRTAADLEPRQYVLIMDLFYRNSKNVTYLNRLFNSTISLSDPVTTLDARTVSMTVLLVAIAGAIIWIVYSAVTAGKKGTTTTTTAPGSPTSPKGSPSAEVSTPTADEFLPEDVRKFMQKKGANQRKSH